MVIAIIAILAAILFPVFARAREKARQASCASGEKQLALGVMMYAQDFDERFALVYDDGLGSSNRIIWPQKVEPSAKNRSILVYPSGPDAASNWPQNSFAAYYGMIRSIMHEAGTGGRHAAAARWAYGRHTRLSATGVSLPALRRGGHTAAAA